MNNQAKFIDYFKKQKKRNKEKKNILFIIFFITNSINELDLIVMI